MKKFLAAILAMCMVFALAACGSEAPAEESAEAPAADTAEAPAEESAEEAAEEAAYTLGLGMVLNTDSSESGKKAQTDGTFAAVVMDAEGKIVSCRLDCVQNKMDITDGLVDTAAEFKTKMEMGEDYGMVAYGNATAEWDVQAKAFEEFAVGKTGAEIEALETAEHEGNQVAADETLYASCTIDITDFKAAVAKACTDPMAVSFTSSDDFTLGVAAVSDASGSVEAGEEDGTVKLYSDFAAAVVGADGKILAALNDAVQPEISIDDMGEILETRYNGTKRELGDDYGMVAYGNASAEWYAQSAAFSEFVKGMSADELMALETKESDGNLVAADETLYASCTIDISGMQTVVSLAAKYAR